MKILKSISNSDDSLEKGVATMLQVAVILDIVCYSSKVTNCCMCHMHLSAFQSQLLQLYAEY